MNNVDLCLTKPGAAEDQLSVQECQYGEGPHYTQKWRFQDGQIVWDKDPSKCVTVTQSAASPHQQRIKVVMQDCKKAPAQLWSFDASIGTIFLTQSELGWNRQCLKAGT